MSLQSGRPSDRADAVFQFVPDVVSMAMASASPASVCSAHSAFDDASLSGDFGERGAFQRRLSAPVSAICWEALSVELA